MFLLRTTEERAQSAEERAFVAESALKEAQERIRALERSISRVDGADGKRDKTLNTPSAKEVTDVKSKNSAEGKNV